MGIVGAVLSMIFWSTWAGPGYWSGRRRGTYVEDAPRPATRPSGTRFTGRPQGRSGALEPHRAGHRSGMTTAEARADRLTYEFVSIASHELRAPIAVVHGIAATLDARVDELPDEQVHALLGHLVVQTDRLRDLADQLLDLSRIESGARPSPELFEPRELLAELVPRIAGDRAANVRVLVEPSCTLVADPVAFERVATNLILNALRYGAPPVEVRVEGDPRRLIVRTAARESRPSSCRDCSSASAAATRAAGRPRPVPASGSSIASAYANALGGELSYEPAPAARRPLHAVATGSSKLEPFSP